MNPDEYPFGQTEYLNYDPEQVNTPKDALDVLVWIAEQNRERDNTVAANIYEDAADLLSLSLVHPEVDE